MTDLDGLRDEWMRRASELRDQVIGAESELQEINQKLDAVKLIQASLVPTSGKVVAHDSGSDPHRGGGGEPDNPHPNVLSWAQSLLSESGPLTVTEIFSKLPSNLLGPFTAAGKLSPEFRLRRLFRRSDRFEVRREDGLVTLKEDGRAAVAPTRIKDSRLLAALLTDSLTDAPVGFLVAGSGEPVEVDLLTLREMIARGVSIFVRGPEGRLSVVEARGSGFRSNFEGRDNDDIAMLPRVART